jgi:Peptidase family M23/Bacterial SH3 domain
MNAMTPCRSALAAVLGFAAACGDEGMQTTLAWEDVSSSAAVEPTSGAPDDDSGAPISGSSSSEGGVPEESGPAPDLPGENDCPRVRVVTPPTEPLNVRPDPSTAGEPIGSLANGMLVTVIAEVVGESVEGNTQWFDIEYQGGHGYVSGVFAQCTLDEPPAPPDGYYLPLPCGMAVNCTQGNMGVTSHNGLHAYAFDFGVPLDTPIVAMADGVVSLIYDATVPGDPCYDGGGPECGPSGNLVIILHGDGTTTLYKHLNVVQVVPGDEVLRGEQIGLSGSTGYATGPHVHVMRMENCGSLRCQSVPMEFVDAGVPVEGTPVVSQNCI